MDGSCLIRFRQGLHVDGEKFRIQKQPQILPAIKNTYRQRENLLFTSQVLQKRSSDGVIPNAIFQMSFSAN